MWVNFGGSVIDYATFEVSVIRLRMILAALAAFTGVAAAQHAGPTGWPLADSAIVPPTRTSAGVALTESSDGHTLRVPLMSTLPAREGSWHERLTVTWVV